MSNNIVNRIQSITLSENCPMFGNVETIIPYFIIKVDKPEDIEGLFVHAADNRVVEDRPDLAEDLDENGFNIYEPISVRPNREVSAGNHIYNEFVKFVKRLFAKYQEKGETMPTQYFSYIIDDSGKRSSQMGNHQRPWSMDNFVAEQVFLGNPDFIQFTELHKDLPLPLTISNALILYTSGKTKKADVHKGKMNNANVKRLKTIANWLKGCDKGLYGDQYIHKALTLFYDYYMEFLKPSDIDKLKEELRTKKSKDISKKLSAALNDILNWCGLPKSRKIVIDEQAVRKHYKELCVRWHKEFYHEIS